MECFGKKTAEGFVEAHNYWKNRAAGDPEWGERNPFRFDVMKENGVLVIRNSMEEFMKAEQLTPESIKTELVKQYPVKMSYTGKPANKDQTETGQEGLYMNDKTLVNV